MDLTEMLTQTVIFIVFVSAITAITIYSSNGLKRKKLQIFLTISTLLVALVGIVYYYFSDRTIAIKTGIVISLSLLIFFIVLYAIEKWRKKESAMLFAIFLNLLSICVILLTK